MILITGGGGFVGRQVVYSLLRREKKLRLLLRPDSPNLPAFEGCHDILYTHDLFKENQDWWSKSLEGVETVVHIAWYTEHGKYLHSDKNLDCLVGTINLAKACIKAGVKRFIGIGTCFEYNLSKGLLDINTELKPSTLYGACKASAFLSLSNLFLNHNLQFAWCRLFYLYGEGEDSRRLLPYLRKQFEKGERVELTSGDKTRDYMDIKEAGRLIADIVCGDKKGAINICSGVPITVREIAEKVADEYNCRHLLTYINSSKSESDPEYILGIKSEI